MEYSLGEKGIDMGVEMAILMGISGAMKIAQAKKQGKAIAETGRIQAEQKKVQTLAKAGRQKASFLASGVTLEGTPLAALDSTYTTGQQDINQITSNANRRSRNVMNQAMSDIVGQAAMMAAMGGFGGGSPAMTMGTPPTASAMEIANQGGTFNLRNLWEVQ